MQPTTITIPHALEIALAHHRAGHFAEAEQIYLQVLAAAPGQPAALHLLGLIALERGEGERALALIREAIAQEPHAATFHDNLGVALRQQGRAAEAVAAHREALRLQPDSAHIYLNLALSATAANLLDEAVNAARVVIDLRPEAAAGYGALAEALRCKLRTAEAVALLQKAAELEPQNARVFNQLGNALQQQDDSAGAAAAFHRALELEPTLPEAHLNLANVCKYEGRAAEAVAAYRAAWKLRPGDSRFGSNLVYAMHFDPATTLPELAAAHREWNTLYIEPLRATHRPFANSRDPERPLRIGYVSADLCDHVIGRNLWPLFREHDRARFALYAYASTPGPDHLTAEMCRRTAGWHEVGGWSDEQVAEQIRADEIDILVDCTLHMHGSRLLVFGRKPAPVQVTFAGYPSTTGVETIDYRLTDPYLDPPAEADGLGFEEPWRLAHSFWCYDPAGCTLEPNRLPALGHRHFTFGCLNNFAKINEPTLARWARVLKAVRGSRLLLLAPKGPHRERTAAFLRELGVKPSHVEFRDPAGRVEYLEMYHRVDVMLDSAPYNGHTTSLDALWMGVPLVTLAGTWPIARAGVSALSNLGHPEWIAQTEDEFVAIATRLAEDHQRLAELRAGLRAEMEASPLMDAAGFTRSIEEAYAAMWRRWCAQA